MTTKEYIYEVLKKDIPPGAKLRKMTIGAGYIPRILASMSEEILIAKYLEYIQEEDYSQAELHKQELDRRNIVIELL